MTAPVEPEGCGYCGDPTHVPTAVIFGSPMADVITVVDSQGIKVCGRCVVPALELALLEARFSGPVVRLEPIKAVA